MLCMAAIMVVEPNRARSTRGPPVGLQPAAASRAAPARLSSRNRRSLRKEAHRATRTKTGAWVGALCRSQTQKTPSWRGVINPGATHVGQWSLRTRGAEIAPFFLTPSDPRQRPQAPRRAPAARPERTPREVGPVSPQRAGAWGHVGKFTILVGCIAVLYNYSRHTPMREGHTRDWHTAPRRAHRLHQGPHASPR